MLSFATGLVFLLDSVTPLYHDYRVWLLDGSATMGRRLPLQSLTYATNFQLLTRDHLTNDGLELFEAQLPIASLLPKLNCIAWLQLHFSTDAGEILRIKTPDNARTASKSYFLLFPGGCLPGRH